jgi:membrane-bound lytic murein transglycosylase D
MRITLLFSFLFLSAATLHAQENIAGPSVENEDSLEFVRFMETMEESLRLYRSEWDQTADYDSIIKALGYETGHIPTFSDSIYCTRLQRMSALSPMPFDCHPSILENIHFFNEKRRSFIKVTMGRAKLYFDLFEAALDRHGLPLELKYLAVIESGLRPQVRSRAGAMGLWQFMYATGKMYGLTENSYIDERMDPEKSTEAACRYLKRLYEIYNDWNLALAAYNAGPGNVNKAIRRSGGKMTYWDVRPFLPKETQGYVPNFVTVAYLMTHHTDHNLIPAPAPALPQDMDTVCLKTGIKMQTLESHLNWPIDDIKALNPIYKTTTIPSTEPKQCLTMPLEKIALFIDLEDSIYRADSSLFHTPRIQPATTSAPVEPRTISTKYHKVKSGETMTMIAKKYGISVSHLMKLNNLRSTTLQVGQTLRVEGTPSSGSTSTATSSSGGKYHTIQTGDTFYKVAQKYGTTVDAIQRLNPGVSSSSLKIGQRIRVQ